MCQHPEFWKEPEGALNILLTIVLFFPDNPDKIILKIGKTKEILIFSGVMYN